MPKFRDLGISAIPMTMQPPQIGGGGGGGPAEPTNQGCEPGAPTCKPDDYKETDKCNGKGHQGTCKPDYEDTNICPGGTCKPDYETNNVCPKGGSTCAPDRTDICEPNAGTCEPDKPGYGDDYEREETNLVCGKIGTCAGDIETVNCPSKVTCKPEDKDKKYGASFTPEAVAQLKQQLENHIGI